MRMRTCLQCKTKIKEKELLFDEMNGNFYCPLCNSIDIEPIYSKMELKSFERKQSRK